MFQILQKLQKSIEVHKSQQQVLNIQSRRLQKCIEDCLSQSMLRGTLKTLTTFLENYKRLQKFIEGGISQQKFIGHCKNIQKVIQVLRRLQKDINCFRSLYKYIEDFLFQQVPIFIQVQQSHGNCLSSTINSGLQPELVIPSLPLQLSHQGKLQKVVEVHRMLQKVIEIHRRLQKIIEGCKSQKKFIEC